MPSIRGSQVFLLLSLLHLSASLPVRYASYALFFFVTQVFFKRLSLPLREEDEVEGFLTQIGHLNAPWSGDSADALLEARLR